ncbi:MAG: penicillin-binding protein 2 [bacterium]|nr:penicillin-binding protein 2 [bacterium]
MVQASFRIRLISILVTLLAAGFIGRLFFIQIVHGAEFSEIATKRFIAVNPLDFDRGSIFFSERDGTLISAAARKEYYRIAINPSELVDPEATYQALSRIATTSRGLFMESTLRYNDPYEEVGITYDPEISKKIQELDIDGLSTYRGYQRYYPAGSRAAHVLGFLGYTSESGDERVGRYGIEQYYNDQLVRRDHASKINVFAEVFAQAQLGISAPTDSFDVITTIEPTVQSYLEFELLLLHETYRTDRVGGIIIDPKTGAVVAMAAVPTFDPNNFKDVPGPEVYINPLVEHVYELGSVIKPLTIAAGLDAKVITPATTYDDTGSRTIDGYTISNYDGRARNTVPIQEILNQSLNIGTVFVAEKLGEDLFREYFNRYRLGRTTGIELPGETSGLTDNLSSDRFIERATASFGQGIAMSPIAFVQALTALANDGAMVRPRIVKALRYLDGTVEEKEPIVMGLPIRPETADVITRMLVNVVDDALLGGSVSLKEYSIAAKTGTAQIAKPGGGYYDDRYLHSFFGYFPAYDPRFLVFLYASEPKDELYASHTLTTPFMNLVTFLLNYYEIPPDRGQAPTMVY